MSALYWMVKAKKLGGHWHVRFFTAAGEDNWAGIGSLTMDERDWASLRAMFDYNPRAMIEEETA